MHVTRTVVATHAEEYAHLLVWEGLDSVADDEPLDAIADEALEEENDPSREFVRVRREVE